MLMLCYIVFFLFTGHLISKLAELPTGSISTSAVESTELKIFTQPFD